MAIRAKMARGTGVKRTVRKKKEEPVYYQPQKPFLHLCRGYVYAPETVSFDFYVAVPLQQLQNRVSIYDIVLRSVLYRPQPVQAGETDSASASTAAARSSSGHAGDKTPRLIVHVESLTIHPESVQEFSYKGGVRLRSTVVGTLANVHYGMLVGVVEEVKYMDTRVVQVSCERPPWVSTPGGNPPRATRHAQLTARCFREDSIAVGSKVVLAIEPGTVQCMAARQPVPFSGVFKLCVAGDEVDIVEEESSLWGG
ncbi:uncharacterized protein TEOVI_000036700 [Trypanosoma equiperdum]|uniref:Uncharacterized protein n=3 Tax=Trypanozoon TaxID=39700 RepID=C9ZJG6_TRYB9|nr:hypothetical protein, conserved [Trypanosoma brucei gambiense DAL972]RHW73973.1 hypothetical protein DPX39_020018900 [Trypanosoma brucei equiperdum]CBH09525.1 hypothetical protein, conserved [Trypanosoma brucei gambiense DAL972]SCU66956.1 hypothetical protein, conserved [Trypanosoma equiperdum]|eukprot:XP_011771830.1 hypothetical protein, conserved [Trypanosoma brucei gambiense DAL972]